MVLEHKQTVIGTDALDFSLQRRGDLSRDSIGDDGNSLFPSQPETNIDRIACAGDQFGINRMEVGAIRHIEGCENYAEIERRQTPR